MISRHLRTIGLSTLLAITISGCATNGSNIQSSELDKNTQEQSISTTSVPALYEVHHDGRIYFFYDQALYKSFLKTGHTAYMVARIGAGPKGETLKFALTGEDKKKQSGIPSIDLIEGKAQPGDAFYGEMRVEGRIYVFDSFQDMNDVRKVGEAPYRFTEIGAGPKGETVVYVLNKTNKKQKPVELITAFKKQNGMQ